MSKRVDEWETVIAIAQHDNRTRAAFWIAMRIDKLARIARTLHRLYEVACSDPVLVCDACGSVAGRKHIPSQCFEARLQAYERRAKAIGEDLGVVVTTQRDPRGAAVKVWADKEDGRMLGCF